MNPQNISAKLRAVCNTMDANLKVSGISNMRTVVGCYDYLQNIANGLDAEAQAELTKKDDAINEHDQSES